MKYLIEYENRVKQSKNLVPQYEFDTYINYLKIIEFSDLSEKDKLKGKDMLKRLFDM